MCSNCKDPSWSSLSSFFLYLIVLNIREFKNLGPQPRWCLSSPEGNQQKEEFRNFIFLPLERAANNFTVFLCPSHLEASVSVLSVIVSLKWKTCCQLSMAGCQWAASTYMPLNCAILLNRDILCICAILWLSVSDNSSVCCLAAVYYI